MKSNEHISVVNPQVKFRKVTLIEPSKHHFLLLAAEIDNSLFPVFLFTSQKKKILINYCKEACLEIANLTEVESAVVFKASLIPPGKGKFLKERPEVHVAKFDVVILIEVKNKSMLETIKSNEHYVQMAQKIKATAIHSLFLSAFNKKRIGPVDHSKQGVFLFNFFFADHLQQNIEIWEYTAGWFEQETDLNNSTLLVPDNPEKIQYKIINHCRWDKMSNIIPSLIFKKSFKTYVLDNFYANKVAAIPILYKLA